MNRAALPEMISRIALTAGFQSPSRVRNGRPVEISESPQRADSSTIESLTKLLSASHRASALASVSAPVLNRALYARSANMLMKSELSRTARQIFSSGLLPDVLSRMKYGCTQAPSGGGSNG